LAACSHAAGPTSAQPAKVQPATAQSAAPQPAKPEPSKAQPSAPAKDLSAYILTPPESPAPRINGARVFGVRPGHPFLYTIAATGKRPMIFAAKGLPKGLKLDAQAGRITGMLKKAGDCVVTLRATNAEGTATNTLKIVVGEKIALTPPLGWNSWNCWAGAVDQDKVLRSAKAMVVSGLINHGWTYVNIDDTWQGKRGGKDLALQSNAKFPDMKGLCDQIHAMGLKAGIYSTPWVASYANHAGGSSDDPNGAFAGVPKGMKFKKDGTQMPFAFGKHSFAKADAKQWGKWGIDYLKYDWFPFKTPQVQEMAGALRESGRDIVYSLSNTAPFAGAADWARLANSWRTTGDIRDTWNSMSKIGFAQDRWTPFAGPGHWNDPDMLVVGYVGWGPRLHPSRLAPDEQYTHISLWCLLSAPLLIGCDMERLDPFTLSLLTNDEVLAIDQDPLGREARRVALDDQQHRQAWAKPLENGSVAVGLFNAAPTPGRCVVTWQELGLAGPQVARDLWRQKDLGVFDGKFESDVASHGVCLITLTPAKPGQRPIATEKPVKP
jgi:alpha-galactosidase